MSDTPKVDALAAFVDALADFVADLYAEGKLDHLCPPETPDERHATP